MEERTWMYRTKDGKQEAEIFDVSQHGMKAKLKRDGWVDHPKKGKSSKSESKRSEYGAKGSE